MNLLGSTYLTTKKHIEPLIRSNKKRNTQDLLTDKFLGEWKARQNIDGDELLKKNLEYATKKVPFYRNYFAHHPEKDPANIEEWPILTRDNLWNDQSNLRSTEPSPWRSWTHPSGGSTGKPVNVVHDEYFAAKAQALRRLCGELFFKGPHYNQLILWGMSQEVERQRAAGNLTSKLKDAVRRSMGLKTSHINTFEFTQGKLEECVRILRRQKPSFIFGYAGSVYELAKYLEEKSIRPPRPPKVIGTTAQTLHPFMRNCIERVFGCRVCDHYGSREVGPIAWQHPDGLMYFPKFFSKIEVVDDDGNPVSPGEQGRILITTLQNSTMPLVRYDIGDLGVLGEDQDFRGYRFSTLHKITGRSSEEFTTLNGSRVCGPFFIYLFYDRPWLDQFYIVQRAYDLIEIMYVPKAPCTGIPQSDCEEITSKIRKVMTDQCQVMWTKVEKIPTTRSGKRLFIRSEV